MGSRWEDLNILKIRFWFKYLERIPPPPTATNILSSKTILPNLLKRLRRIRNEGEEKGIRKERIQMGEKKERLKGGKGDWQ
jgi:hypothetical protein